MARRDKTKRKAMWLRARPRHPAVAWLAALALILQIGLSVAPVAPAASPGEPVAAALSAALGRRVSLCAEVDHPGAPDHPRFCCGDCALCGFAAGAASLAPPRPAESLAPRGRIAAAFAPPDEEAAPPAFFAAARPRAPPRLA